MLDREVGQLKKTVERKKYPQVVNALKEFVDITIIIKCILDLKMNLTIDELLALAPAVEKKLTKAIIEDKVI